MTSDTPFEVVNLRDSNEQHLRDSNEQHLGVLMSDFEIDTTCPPNSDLEIRLFRYSGNNSNNCTNCRHNNATSVIIMGDYYEFDEKSGLWKPERDPFQFLRPMLTPQAFLEKYQSLEPEQISQVYSLPRNFWNERVSNYVRFLIENERFEEMYKQTLYEIVTTPPSLDLQK